MNPRITAKVLASLLAAALFAAAPLARAGESASTEKKPNPEEIAKLNKVIETASVFYQTLQLKPETAIPDAVVAKAKGVLIIDRWSGGVLLGGTAGNGIGLKKNKDGKFSAPAFYDFGGGSMGIQIGGGNTKTIAFLMTDKGLLALTDDKMSWGGEARAVAGPSAAATNTLDDSADVILYTQQSGFDLGASFSGVKITMNNEGNRAFYNNATITPSDIFDGKATMPEGAKTLAAALDKQAAAKPAAPATAAAPAASSR